MFKKLRFVLAWAFGLIYIWLAHQSAYAANGGWLPVFVGLTPITIGALVLVWHSRWRPVGLVAWLLAVSAAVACNPWLAQHIVWVYFLQSVGTDLLLAGMFGRTLGTPDNSLCTRMARAVHPHPLPELNVRYSYRVTVAWTAYFLISATISATLFLSGQRILWSWFANLLCLPLVGAMFVGEHIVRMIVIPPEYRVGFLDTIRSIRTVEKPSHLL